MSKKNNPSLTTIITSYNTGTDICRAINSVMSQLPISSECIVVDDGSTDDTVSILKEYSDKYDNLHIFFCEHQGVSITRNYGISKAKCNLITFLDGDDFLLPGFFERSKTLLSQDFDLYIFSIENEENFQIELKTLNDYVYPCVSDFADDYIRKGDILFYSNCNKVYKRDIIIDNKLKFKKEWNYGEDRLFNYDYLKFCNSIATSSIYKFRYIHSNTDSLTSIYIPNFPSIVSVLHKRKIECILELPHTCTIEEKERFVQKDHFGEYSGGIIHLLHHQMQLSKKDRDCYCQQLLEMRATYSHKLFWECGIIHKVLWVFSKIQNIELLELCIMILGKLNSIRKGIKRMVSIIKK